MSLSTTESFAAKARAKRKRPAPFPIRLSHEERAHLERKAGNRPLGTYIRERLLGDEAERRKSVRVPSVDYALLGRVLGLLGESELARHMCLLAVAAESGRVNLAEEDRSALRDACSAVTEMRALLVRALGLRSGGTP